MTMNYDHRKYIILYVDDEAQSLKYFEKAMGEEFSVLTAESAERAREIIADRDDIGVVISDQRMPKETGVGLLSWLREERPYVVRMLTTAYSDLDSAIDAVNSGAIFRYIVKPWELKELRGALLHAMEFHMVQRERDILLREKLTVLQRLIVVDRVRSFAVLAVGLANRLRNPLRALKAFLDVAPIQDENDNSPPMNVRWDDVWTVARSESDRVVELIQSVVDMTTEPEYNFDTELKIEDLSRSVIEELTMQPGPTIESLGEVPQVTVDRAMARQLLRALFGRAQQLRGGQGELHIQVSAVDNVGGQPGTRLEINLPGSELNSDEVADLFAVFSPGHSPGDSHDSDLLAAYFIAFHHGGNLLVHPNTSDGPSLELLLPVDPSKTNEAPLEENWVERVFTLFEH